MRRRCALVLCLAASREMVAQRPAPQTESARYARSELLAPGSAKFKVTDEVTATTAGATTYFIPIQPGAVATEERVVDRTTGKPLPFDVVDGGVARAGGVRNADASRRYMRITLARPVPTDGGGGRLLIVRTYHDAATYFLRGDTIVFTRPLAVKRNTIVLPAGYELVSNRFPSQVLQEADGRIAVSLWNDTPSDAAVSIRARPARVAAGKSAAAGPRLDERAHQNREIVYFLQPPETHAFDLYHDYTESRVGTSTYINEVRAGSTVSNPRARNLDTGDDLKWEILKGDAITGREPRRAERDAAERDRRLSIRAGENGRIDSLPNVRDVHRYGALQAGR